MQTATVDNPDWTRDRDGLKAFPRKITAIVNLHECAISTMAQKGVLNGPQVAAADRFRAFWERKEGFLSKLKAIDYGKPQIDYPGVSNPYLMTHDEAVKELRRARELLGSYGYQVVSMLAGERMSIHQIFAKRRDRDTASDMLKHWLTDLAVEWGFQSNRK